MYVAPAECVWNKKNDSFNSYVLKIGSILNPSQKYSFSKFVIILFIGSIIVRIISVLIL